MKIDINTLMRLMASKLEDEEDDEMEDEEEENSNEVDHSKDKKLVSMMSKKYKGKDAEMKKLMDQKRKAVILMMIKNKRNEAKSK